MVIKEVIVALALLTLANRSFVLSCLPCHELDCGPAHTCSYGFTKGVCGCCDICAKGPGEKCGGPWGSSGTCSDGLECQFDQSFTEHDFNKEGVCVETVPCDPRGGQIKQRQCCPWHSTPWMTNRDPSQCTKYDVCVCRDGFIGNQCEHDCKKKGCSRLHAPVCAGDGANGLDITFNNKCIYFNARCNKEFVFFMYDGECQDDALCGGPIICPADTSVEYYDDPYRPGCKLCRDAPNKDGCPW